jgi:hypothetical protein
MSGASLPSHLIQRRDVAVWLAGSAVEQIMTHWTTPGNALRIREVGVRIHVTAPDSKWGQGLYTSTRPLPEYGEVGVRVAIRLQNPLVVYDQVLAQEEIDEMLARAESKDVRAVLLAAGYDGVIVHWESGELWAVAFDDEQLKVIQED